jgi:hypothetical protein
MFKFIKRLLAPSVIKNNVKSHHSKIEKSENHIPNNLIDVLSVRETSRFGRKTAPFNSFRLTVKGHINVEIIKIKQVNNGQISEISRDYNSVRTPVYETYLRSSGYNIRFTPHEIKDVESKYPSTQYDWETSGVNIVEVYQQAFLGQVDGKLRIRSIIRYADIKSPHYIKEKNYYHENDEKILIKDVMLSEIFLVGNEKLFVRNNTSGFEFLVKPTINIDSNSPRGKILYDSRFPKQTYKELLHLRL